MRILFVLVLALSSCSQFKTKKRSFVDEVKEENISNQTVMDLARSSYLRGCVDSKNYWFPEKTKAAFPKCLKMAREHEKDIQDILTQELKN